MSEQTPKRYDLITNYRAGSSIEEMEPADDGEWVRWESIEVERATLTARCEALESERNEARMAATELLTAVGLAKDGLAIERVRCEALEQDRKDFRDEVHTLAKACTDTALERDALKVRCEALTAERDRQAAEIEAWKLDYAIAVASRDAEIARLGGKPGEVGGGTGEGDAPDRPDRQTYMQADSTTLAERNEAVKAVASLSTRYVTLAARCEALEQENAAQAEQITDLAKALREVQDTAAGFKASLSDAKQKQEPT